MRSITKRVKQAVEVIADIDSEGRITPLEIIWSDGRRWPIDSVTERRRAESVLVGIRGYRYAVFIMGRRRFLWAGDDRRWYVEKIVS